MSTQSPSDIALANTWKWFPSEPVAALGYAISCPSCGSADDIRFWLYPDKATVRAEHTCIPYKYGRKSKMRRWDEPRVTPDDVRSNGVDMKSEFDEHLAPLAREFAQRFR
jgi:hypothetical protein